MELEMNYEKASTITAVRAYKPARMNGAALALIGRPKPQIPLRLSV
jgi:hypothetical protein